MKRPLFLLFIFLLATRFAGGQTVMNDSTAAQVTATAQQYADSLAHLGDYFRNWRYTGSDTLSNPYYALLFSAPTFYSSAIHDILGTLPNTKLVCPTLPSPAWHAHLLRDNTNKALTYVYTQQPWIVQHSDMTTAHEPSVSIETEVKPPVKLSERAEADHSVKTRELKVPDMEIEIRKPNFWIFKGDVSFQLMQNYVSSNWYKGGESNHALLAAATIQANYDNKQKLTFNNKLEMKLGFQSSHSDEKHKYKTNSDLIRLTNELGLRATKHWFYSAMLQTWTQFYRGYHKNDDKVYSDIMSPFESLLTLGMKYSLETRNKRFKVDVNISPFAAHLLYVGRPSLRQTFGLPGSDRAKFEYGSNITATHAWTICKNVTWKGRFYYYTNYDKAQVEWENTFNLQVNKFLSTQLFLYPRFDDGVARKGDSSYFQFTEQLSVGLNISL